MSPVYRFFIKSSAPTRRRESSHVQNFYVRNFNDYCSTHYAGFVAAGMWSGLVTMDGSVVVVVGGCYSGDGIKGDNNLPFNVKRKF